MAKEKEMQTNNPEAVEASQETAKESKKANKPFKMGFFYKLRRDPKFRITLIVSLMAILVALYIFWGKFRIFIAGLFLLLLVALGMEVSGTDLDLGTLVETGSIEESRIDKTDSGRWDIGGACAKDKLNCSSFEYQEDAQELFEECGGLDDDVHGLDGDNDGIVCEALPYRYAN